MKIPTFTYAYIRRSLHYSHVLYVLHYSHVLYVWLYVITLLKWEHVLDSLATVEQTLLKLLCHKGEYVCTSQLIYKCHSVESTPTTPLPELQQG
jgi:hypothetical protein